MLRFRSARRRCHVAGAAGLIALSLVLAGCGSSAAPVAAPGPSIAQEVDAALPPAVGQAPLVASSGARFDLASLTGKVVVISDVMTLCQETCPLDTANIVAAARAVDKAGLSGKVEFLSITIDPTRDTPAQLAAYRQLYAPAPSNWLVATATPTTIATMWKQLGVYIQRVPDVPPAPRNWRTGQPLTYDLTHSDQVFFLDRHGHERFLFDGAPHVAPGAPVPAALSKFLDAQGHNKLTHPDSLAWTLPEELDVLSWLSDREIGRTSSS